MRIDTIGNHSTSDIDLNTSLYMIMEFELVDYWL